MKNRATSLSLALLAIVAVIPFHAHAGDYSETLTGDWGGARTSLDDAGVSTEIVYKADVMSNVAGGLKEGTRGLDNLDVVFGFDGQKLVGVEGLSGVVHLLNNNGGRPNEDLVGSAQGVNNIEVSRSTGKLFQAFLQQNFYQDRLSILAGLYDVNTEFYVTEISGLFIHPTFGIGTDASQSGENGPSIFPFSSFGTRMRVHPTEATYAQVAVLDGVSADPDRLSGNHQTWANEDGLLMLGEAGYTPAGAKIGVGGWYYTSTFEHQTEITATGDPFKEHSHGIYLLGEKELYTESEGEGLAGFARFGVANDAVNQFDYAWSVGLVYTGLIPTRDIGQLGFGVTGAHNGDAFNDATLAGGTEVDSAETTMELTYSDNLTPWLSVQPDVQYVMNPNTDKSLKNAWVLGTRLTVSF
jgi:porin